MSPLPTASEIDDTLSVFTTPVPFNKVGRNLKFPPIMEAAFEAETGGQRAHTLAALTVAAIVLSYLFLFTDYVFTPYLFFTCAWLRLLPAPIGLFVILRGGQSSVRVRETALTAFVLAVVIVVAIVASISRESLSVYSYYLASLCIVVAISAFPLRFGDACWLAALGLVSSASIAEFYRHPSVAVLIATQFVMVIPMPFLLMANYRSEKAVRTAWLLSTRETLRLAQLRAEREKLEMIARTDSLTGLANRGHFDRYLRSHLLSRVHASRFFGFIILDVDFFKRYNDVYGHPAGDECLRLVAKILSDTVRGQSDDLVFRYGGEEFGVLLSNMTDSAVLQTAERIRKNVQEAAIQHGNREDGLTVVTVSVGTGFACMTSEHSMQHLIESADDALYQAKQQGRNRVCGLHPLSSALWGTTPSCLLG